MKRILITTLSLALTIAASAIDIKTVRTAGPFRIQQPLVIDSVDAAQRKINMSNYMTLLNTPLSLDLVKTGLIQHLEGNSAKTGGTAPAPKDSTMQGTAPQQNTMMHQGDSTMMPRQREMHGQRPHGQWPQQGMMPGMGNMQNMQQSAKPIKEAQIQLAGFSFTNDRIIKADVKVTGPRYYTVYFNGMPQQNKMTLQPGRWDVVVKYIADSTNVALTLNADKEEAVTLIDTEAPNSDKRPFTMSDNMLMKHYSSVGVSPSGKYALIVTNNFDMDGKTQYNRQLVETATGKIIRDVYVNASWMPHTDRYIYTRRTEGKVQLVSVDPLTLKEEIIYGSMPTERFTMSPTEDFIIYTQEMQSPKKEQGVYQVLTMDDRQPGWRNRGSLMKMDLRTGLVQPLTYNHSNVWTTGISEDGRYAYIAKREERLEKRPTSVTSLYRMNLETMEADTLIEKEGFLNTITVIPGTNKLAITGSPEVFGGIGNNVPEGMTPSIYDYRLYLFDVDTKKATAVARNFIPTIKSVTTNGKDGFLYIMAENADSVSLYRYNLKSGAISFISQPCEVLQTMDIASNTGTLIFCGSSACTPDRVYSMSTKNFKPVLISDVNAERMAKLELGTCEAWKFRSERGYDITGHVYLPANYDKTKKYPMIVHYYGGCSPTTRRFGGGSHYPAHYWNALGYITLVVNPSGATGFGQEWAARHVNTAGEGPAQDIIEATKWYADNHAFVDSAKIGCVSASYGGFMTQYMMTKTDMFACGISHAGISDHTSYWGEGYWGYSYSEVSMANSYPWTRKDLYVDCSPLYNADKIHKPLLFTHGTADTNVPIGESIQMYTALKLLGVPTAFVMVEGENHGIMDYSKRQKWINTMTAWFDKYLKGDSTWWDMIYTPKEL